MMKIVLSSALQTYMTQVGSSLLRVKLDAARCCNGAYYGVSVDTRQPQDPSKYVCVEQDGLQVFVATKLAQHTSVIELEYGRRLFGMKTFLVGPEELLDAVLMGFV